MKTTITLRSLLLLVAIACFALSSASQAANPNLLYIKPPMNEMGGIGSPPTALADLNHDGKTDLVRTGFDQVRVQFGNGDGTFGNLTDYQVGSFSYYVAVADINNDTHPDIVVANVNDKTVSVLPGNGNGSFQPQIVTNVALSATAIALTDFNNDGKVDLVVAGYVNSPLEGYISTLAGTGIGTFVNRTTFQTSPRSAVSQVRGLAVGDVNGDGWPDLVVTNPRVDSIASFINNRNGTFAAPMEMQPPGVLGHLTLADFNGDAKLDLAYLLVNDPDFGNTGAGSNVGVAMGSGDGTFGKLVNQGGPVPAMQNVTIYAAGSTPDTFISRTATIVAADMDGDSILDLVTTADSSSTSASYVAILRSGGNGSFTFGNRVTSPYKSGWLSVAELNSDGTLDMVATPSSASAQAFITGVVAPIFTSTNATGFITARNNSFTVTASGNPPPTFSATGTLPGGVTFTSAGVLSGVPAVGSEGTYPLTITAMNSAGQTATQAFTLTVTRQDLLVTTAVDEDDGTNDPSLGAGTSLREAVNYAQTLAGPQTIIFAPELAGATINLTITGNSRLGSSALRIEKNVTIQGLTGMAGITLRRGTTTGLRHFLVEFEATLTLNDLTLTNGLANGSQSGGPHGGAIFNQGTLRMNRCTLHGNTANWGGGAIVSGIGGPGQTLVLTNCTLTGNQAGLSGGAIDNQQTSSATLTNVTIAGNVITSSSADQFGGGILNSGQLLAINTIVARNTERGTTVPSDVRTISSGVMNANSHHNMIGTGGGGGLTNGVNGNLVGVANPRLAALAANGGATPTIALQAGSPAVNAGSAIAGVTSDQRGISRPQLGAPDVGAYEYNGPVSESLIVTTIADENNFIADPAYGSGTSLREALVLAQSLGGSRTVTIDSSLGGKTITLTTGWNDANDDTALRVTSGFIFLQGPTSSPGVTIAVPQGAARRHITVESAGFLDVSNLTFTNGRGGYGGSIWSFGALKVRNCTFTGNTADHEGGAIQSWGGSPLLAVENSTFTGNTSANLASAIGVGAVQTSLRYVTITGNTSPNGVLWIYETTATLVNSIVAGNSTDSVVTSGGNGSGTFSPQSSNNILGASFAAGLTNGSNANQLGVSATQLQFGSLGNNGGPTPTIALQPGSLAIDAGVAISELTADQRGSARPNGAASDIGAFELVQTAAAIPIVSPLGGTYQNDVEVSIASTSPGATIRYTVDGSDPSSSNGQVYSAPFTLTTSATVKAIAVGGGWLASPVASVGYTVLPPLPFWRQLHGLLADASQDFATPAGDGVANLLKYAFNTAPNAGDLSKPNFSVLQENGNAGLPHISIDEQNRLEIAFVRRKASSNPGISYTVETGDDLSSLTALDLSGATVTSIDAKWERVSVIDPTVTPNRFGRVRIAILP